MSRIKYKNGYYEGEVNSSGDEHGEGTFYWDDGSQYKGLWKNGERDGFGTYFDSDGEIYEGYWKEGKKEGEGKLYKGNGVVIEGTWVDNYLNGVAIFYLNDEKAGLQYYVNGVKKEEMTNEEVIAALSGNLNKSKKRKIIRANGEYEGEVNSSDLPDGEGRIDYYNGNIYIGSFKDGKFHGHGTFYWASGSWLEGEWKDDLKHGYCEYHDVKGNIHRLFLENDEITGVITSNDDNETYQSSNNSKDIETSYSKSSKTSYHNSYDGIDISSGSNSSSRSNSIYDSDSYDSYDNSSNDYLGEVHRDYVTGKIDNIGGERLKEDAYGNLESIGSNYVEYEFGHYGERDHIKSIGGKEVKYDYVTGKIKSIGGREPEYEFGHYGEDDHIKSF